MFVCFGERRRETGRNRERKFKGEKRNEAGEEERKKAQNLMAH